jgi:hypothetical protein
MRRIITIVIVVDSIITIILFFIARAPESKTRLLWDEAGFGDA